MPSLAMAGVKVGSPQNVRRPEPRNHSTLDEEADSSLQANAAETQSQLREAKTIRQPLFTFSGCFSLLPHFSTRIAAYLLEQTFQIVVSEAVTASRAIAY